MISLYPHQKQALAQTKKHNKVLYALDMGLGKTYVASEKAKEYLNPILIVCQKSKISDWYNHYKDNYNYKLYNLTKKKDYENYSARPYSVAIINYDLVFRRNLKTRLALTLILDESSLISNPQSKRYKAISKLNYQNVIMLSGTVTSGYYHKIWTQAHLLGWNITKTAFEKRYVKFHILDNRFRGFPIRIPYGCKNEKELKHELISRGTVFMKTNEVIDLPAQRVIDIPISCAKEYRDMERDGICHYGGEKMVGDMTLTKLLYMRQLTRINKLKPLKDLLDSTNDRVIIFYNFNCELNMIMGILGDRHISIVNGERHDLSSYEKNSRSVTLVQFQAGAYGLNLQLAHIMIFFSPTCKADDYCQAMKRTHRIGQNNTCIYYRFICGIENKIYSVIEQKKDYIAKLFEKDQFN